ncbi:hypothetical protein ABMA32_17585 [Mesorhizobium sp. VNQ89]|uniref:hypothetical protein n=1 Tax=Mesorhizobium quangtriensis TaxID=3157709 RepID=UPI0032B80FE3
MSNRDWLGSAALATVGLGVCLFLGILLAGVTISEYAKVHEVNAAYQRNAEQDRQHAANEAAASCEGISGAAFRACVSQALESYYREQATNEDLKAQKDMAFWAFMIFALGIVQTGLSGVGIWYVILNLREARKVTAQAAHGNRQAARAAIAAQNSADEARRANEASDIRWVVENRPWLTIESEPSVHLFSHGGKRINLRVELTVKNVGKTPAFDVELEVRLATSQMTNAKVDVLDTMASELTGAKKEWRFGNKIVFPNKVEHMFGMTEDLPEITPQEAIGLNLHVFICVIYRTKGQETAFHTAIGACGAATDLYKITAPNSPDATILDAIKVSLMPRCQSVG